MEEENPLYKAHLDIFNHLCLIKNSKVLSYLMNLLIEIPIQ